MQGRPPYAIPRAKIRCCVIAALSLAALQAVSAEESPAYLKAIGKRADKIVAPLEIEKRETRERVHDLITRQYRWLNQTHSQRDALVASLQEEPMEPTLREQKVLQARAKAAAKINQRHAVYLKALSAELTPTQVNAVKDGMTYGVVPITYGAYVKMLPELTEAQQQYIMAQLEAARELAMDAGTSDEKHKWFGKYKGRINNYLSQAGYDLKAASKRVESQR